jgi:uncharacterized protein DUF1761
MRVNYLAVIVAAIVYWLLGALWYSPLLLANRWVALMGKTMEQMKQSGNSPMPYIIALVCNLVIAYVLALVCNASGATTMAKGASTGILMWLGFVGTITLTTYQFDGRPVALWAINYGYALVGMIIMGAILGAWKKKTT